MRKLLAVVLFMVASVAAHAQEEPEYRLELGAAAGLVTYVGDFNSNLLKGMQPWGALVAKYRMNPRNAIALDLGMGKIKGSTADVSTSYPIEPYAFSHSIVEADLRYEYNFWAFGTGEEYRGARRITPFITLGAGATWHGGENKGMTINLPIGAGVKFKIGQRLNLTAEWVMRFTMSDNLDGRKDVYGIESSGLFKNTDCYSVLQVALTYDLWAKCKTCHNDRD